MTKLLFLVGFMASGKSTIGALLASHLSLPFIDTDTLIEQEFGSSIAEIFRGPGEQTFREAERRTIRALLDEEARVIATGGGAFMDQNLREEIKNIGTAIWLDPPFEVLSQRLAKSSSRPLATAASPEKLRELWERRRRTYQHAHLHIRAGDDEPLSVVQQIIERLQRS